MPFQNGGMGGDVTLDLDADNSIISVGAPDPGLLTSNSLILLGLNVVVVVAPGGPPEPIAIPGGDPLLFMTPPTDACG